MFIIILTKRQKQLLEYLRMEVDFQTVGYFSKKLGVSERTLHSELKAIESYVNSSGGYLEKKRGVGIILQNLKERETEQILGDSALHLGFYSIFNRRLKIMESLLFSQEMVSFNSLSELFLVSKTSIKNDFEYVMKILSVGNKIILVRDGKGTRLSGSEEDFQKACLQFNRYLLVNSDCYQGQIVLEKIKLFESYYGENVVAVCTSVLYSYVKEHVNAISDYYIQNVLNIFIILVFRIINGHHLALTRESKKVETDQVFFQESANQMLKKAALRLNFNYVVGDEQYLAEHLISNRFENLPEDQIDDEIVASILLKVSQSLAINFSEDQKLEQQLKNHIPPMIYRLKLNNNTENPFTAQIKNEFALTFNVIWLVLNEFEEELGIAFTEDEIAFLTMYFQAAIERAKMNRKILVVCQMGIATSEFLVNRLKNAIPSFDSLEVASVSELEQLNLDEFDLVIATIKLELPRKKVIQVSPFLSAEDINKITQAGVQLTASQKYEEATTAGYLPKFIESELTYVNTNFSTKEELITYVGQRLIEKGYGTKTFVTSISEREELGGTDLPSGTAVPHGSSLYARKTVIAIVKNKKKFKWHHYYVDLIFVICIADEEIKETRNILAAIYRLIDDPDKLKLIRGASTKDTLKKMIGSET